MGELIEIETRPKCNITTFYRMTGSSFRFEVKASGYIAIGLAKLPPSETPILTTVHGHPFVNISVQRCDFFIGIGCHKNRSWISKVNHQKVEKIIPNILSNEEYRCFWISWSNDLIKLGRDKNPNSLISCKDESTFGLNFVVLSNVEGGTDIAYWRFDLAPLIENLPFKMGIGGTLHWVSMTIDDPLPKDAVVGGFEEESLYIIRIVDSGSMLIGKYAPLKKSAYVCDDGIIIKKKEFEILCGFDLDWYRYYHRNPTRIYVAGDSVNNEPVYIGRIKHEDNLIPGTVNIEHMTCMAIFQKRAIIKNVFEILVNPHEITNHPTQVVSKVTIHDIRPSIQLPHRWDNPIAPLNLVMRND